jgi:ubiquinone/menaquinone biosynthesis C-methylase UbiE
MLLRTLYLWACERLYHEFAWSYDPVSRLVSGGAWPAWRRLALAEAPDGRLLEIGFGTGELLAEMAAAGRDVVGLELSTDMQRVAARRLARAGLVAPRVQAPAQHMPLAAGAFDAVIATFPAPYILEPATLAECYRVLRPGGCLIVAGLWVAPQGGWRRAVPVFYAAPTAHQVDAMGERVAEAGFAVEWRVRLAAGAEVPLLVGTRAAV